MTTTPIYYDTSAKAALDAAAATVDGGTLKVYSGSQPAVNGAVAGTLLATATLNATAFAASSASGGTVTATANAITGGTAAATGTATWFALEDSSGNVQMTGSAGTSDTDLILSSNSITEGAAFSVSSLTLTLPETGGA